MTENNDNLEAFLNQPGGMILFMDLVFKEECYPDESTISSIVGLQDEYERLKKILDVEVAKAKKEAGEN